VVSRDGVAVGAVVEVPPVWKKLDAGDATLVLKVATTVDGAL
jgi:hypothetical protein